MNAEKVKNAACSSSKGGLVLVLVHQSTDKTDRAEG